MSQEKGTVLVVEDQKINREILKGILRNDFTVIEATNGQEAFEVLKEHPEVDAILLDILMPVMDGYAFLAQIKKTPFAGIPTIAVTGENDEGAEQRILDLGVWDFVTKPYQPMTLVTRLKNAIKRNEYFRLGDLLLNSLGVPVAVFGVQDKNIRLIRCSTDFDGRLAEVFGFDSHLGVPEQPFLIPEEWPTIANCFQETSTEKNTTECRFHIISKDGKKEMVQMVLRYWGVNKTSVLLFGEFSRV